MIFIVIIGVVSAYYTPEGDVLCYRLGVRLSVSNFPPALLILKPLNDFEETWQTFTTLRRRAEAMFRMAHFKVKVILRVQASYDCVCIALHFLLVTVLLFLFGRSYFVSLIFLLNYFPFMLAYFVTFLLFAVRQKTENTFFMVQHGWYFQLFGVFGHFYTWLVFSGWGLRFFFITSILFNWTILLCLPFIYICVGIYF